MILPKYRKLSDLRELDRNPRTISKKQFDTLKKSLSDNKDYFEARPIILSNRTGELVIIAGNQRYKAAKALGMIEVPTVLLEGLTEDREREIIIRDNVSNGDWDMDILANEWDAEELEDWGVENVEINLKEKAEEEIRSLKDDFSYVPVSVINTQATDNMERKRDWLVKIGDSRAGRKEHLFNNPNYFLTPAQQEKLKSEYAAENGRRPNSVELHDFAVEKGLKMINATSEFNPVVAEALLRWFAPVGGKVFDPFAGGNVRGLVSVFLGHEYTGIDISEKQVKANNAQAEKTLDAGYSKPEWICGDSFKIPEIMAGREGSFDFILSCPPYGDLEKYSDDPDDLSNMPYDEFIAKYKEIIKNSAKLLKPNRFAAFVVGDIRDKQGFYRGFVRDTIDAFNEAGLRYYNQIIVLDSTAGAMLRARGQFANNRKVVKCHQNIIVGLSGEADAEIYERIDAERLLLPIQENIVVGFNGEVGQVRNDFDELSPRVEVV